jgi:hypothetical protein
MHEAVSNFDGVFLKTLDMATVLQAAIRIPPEWLM